MGKRLNLYTFTIGFPIWWYFEKLPEIITRSFYKLIALSEYIRLDVMIENFFVPLYQDRTFTGRIVSILIRSLWIIIDLILELMLFLFLLIFIIIWIAILPTLTYLIIFNIINI